MNNTIIYLIRHAETFEENGIRNTDECSQIINEKEILSVHGEEQSKRLSKNEELKNMRLQLVNATSVVIKNSLNLLGIDVVDEM